MNRSMWLLTSQTLICKIFESEFAMLVVNRTWTLAIFARYSQKRSYRDWLSIWTSSCLPSTCFSLFTSCSSFCWFETPRFSTNNWEINLLAYSLWMISNEIILKSHTLKSLIVFGLPLPKPDRWKRPPMNIDSRGHRRFSPAILLKTHQQSHPMASLFPLVPNSRSRLDKQHHGILSVETTKEIDWLIRSQSRPDE